MPRGNWLAAAAAPACSIVLLAGGCGGSSHQNARTRTTPPRGRPRIARPVHVRPYRQAVPILMYHEVRKPPPGAPNPRLFVSASTFRAEAGWLARNGFHGITLVQLRQAWKGRRKLPRRPVVLTFDDGYLSVYRNVVPTLRRLHWPAVLNLALGNTKSAEGVTRAEVRRMMRAGWELASHTISHLDLTTLGSAQLREELVGSRRLIRRWFHVTASDFCYPAGRYDQRVVRAVRRAGYRTATTVSPGLATPRHPFELPRIRIEESDGVRGLGRTLAALHR
jgi:peptidoglycan/xylan/chitin deacetylase (PgdA/CDA1 family)